jgi:hypothetical protein
MIKIFFLLFSLSTSAHALTPLNPQNILGMYDMRGIVHLKASVLPHNQIEATKIGIFDDTECTGKYTYNPANNEVEATFDCEGDRLYQKFSLKNKYLEDLEEGTTVQIYLEYKQDKYNLEFDVTKEQSYLE